MVLRGFPDTLNVFLTARCNLSCSYCYINNSCSSQDELAVADIKRAITEFLCLPGEKKNVSFSGGEPLLKIRELIGICRDLKDRTAGSGKISISLTSNGTLLNKKNYRFIKNNNISLKLSIDGDRKSHDLNRFFKAGDRRISSHVRIRRNIRETFRGKSARQKIGASLVFTPVTAPKLLKNIEHLNRSGFTSIDFYPELYARWSNSQLDVFESVMKDFAGYYISLILKSNRRGNLFGNTLIHNVITEEKLYKSLSCDTVHLGCDGNFYYCDKVFSLPAPQRSGFVVGNVKRGIDNGVRLKLLEEKRRQIKKDSGIDCTSCGFLKYCFCPIGQYIYFSAKGLPFKPCFRQFCRISKIYIKNFLEIKKAINSLPLFRKQKPRD